MTQAKICILIAIVLYLGLVLYIGYRCSKKNKNTDDFYLGGRTIFVHETRCTRFVHAYR